MTQNSSFRRIHCMAVGVAILTADMKLAGSHAQEVGIEQKLVRTEKLANAPGQNLTVITLNSTPGGKSVEHRHAGSGFAYVLTGVIESENSATVPAKV